MEKSLPAGKVVRFGAFEADLCNFELRKHGLRLRLAEQPFQILAILLERPGTMVTREELRERLWPGDTFVDFDHGLNNAVMRLREALGDSSDRSRYIETVPRHGYRFIAAVEPIPALSANRLTQVPAPTSASRDEGAVSVLPGAPVHNGVPAAAQGPWLTFRRIGLLAAM